MQWAGYDSDADRWVYYSQYAFSVTLCICSWEPSENVQQCDRLLASFWKYVGMDDKDYPVGYEVAAGQSWISPYSITLFPANFQPFTDKEKQYFAETFVKSSKRKSDKATKKVRQIWTPSTRDSSTQRVYRRGESRSRVYQRKVPWMTRRVQTKNL